ncbi:hypothetical protein ACH4KT_31950 [Streptomyces anulatus]
MLVRSRSGADITAAYPELLPSPTPAAATRQCWAGEIVALDDQGRSDFERLQQRTGLAGTPARAVYMAARVPCT